MADEGAPGPSPAYDPWRADGARPDARAGTGHGVPSPSADAAPAGPRPPVRNADGSWTVEVHDDGAHRGASGAYPEPRRPLTAATPVQQPQPWMQQPGPGGQAGASQAMPPQGPPPRRRSRRLGLVLGIAIPVALVGAGAVAAALVVPGVLVERDAQAAADDYATQTAAWASVYSDAALQPLAELDTAAFDAALAGVATGVGSGSYDEVVPDVAPLRASCDAFASLSGQAAMLSAPRPSLRVVEGGERNDAYAQAVADAAASQGRLDAAETLANDVDAPFSALASGCALVLAQADADAAFADAYDAWLATLTVPQGGTERYDVSASEWITFTCNADTGCAPFVDRAARAASGDAWDAAFVAYDQAMAQSYRDHCPAEDLRPVCDAWATMHDGNAQLAAAVGAAYRSEDVTGGAVAGDASPAPDLVAAVDAFAAGEQTNRATASAQTSAATGAATMLQVVADVVRTEGQAIRDAAAVVRG
ncbi:hypothetical protein GCM10009846_10630 [Agrococcus versicolor]|uniref:Uncharacterized protein n=1 Tax=Agrococcus versicolor TaxID=501482 RepID=A0ABN3AMW9_9MICO